VLNYKMRSIIIGPWLWRECMPRRSCADEGKGAGFEIWARGK